ncbi:hypothetical protein AB0M95_31725 [Sphaerisporangium sp. NPDC051017]|uniref:HORMA-1 domain-containing protein n=1 Tax=Sphaerisporangium sp. NPDC051017 TaxID=3154636 RepID=UPI00342235B0
MTISATRSGSITITDARYVGAKIGADLRQLNSLYGRPPISDIDDFAEEAAQLLKGGYLETVDYGFYDASANTWKLRTRYRAVTGGHLLDSRPGSLPRSADIADLDFLSYLTYSRAFLQLPPAERERITGVLPVTRVTAAAPTAAAGLSQTGSSYARKGIGVIRDVYQAL